MRVFNCFSPVPKAVVLTAFLLLCSVSFQAAAHHSAACCDFNKSVPVEGVVKSIEVANPHIKLVLVVTGKDGQQKEIYYEGHSRNNVYRRGWRPGMIKAGDKITIYIAPKKSGEDGGYVKDWTTADGHKF